MEPRPDRVPFDERVLVERARSDVDAFAELYRSYVQRVHDFALRRTGSVELAEDVTAATFESVLRGLPRYRWRDGGIGPWIFRIAANELADHYRRASRATGDRAQRARDRLHDRVAVDDHDAVDRDDEIALVRAALDQLNPRYQRVLSLRYLSDMDHKEAARAMGVAPGLMAVLVHRATAALRRAVAAHQGTETTN